MAFLEDVVDSIASEITAIGLSADGTTEYAGTGYAAQTPTYPAASAGATDISNGPLQFDGDANDGPITHLIYKRAAGDVFRTVDASMSFNSDGRLDVSSAPITAAFPA